MNELCKMNSQILLVFIVIISNVLALPDGIRIGGIFDPQDQRQELAFRYAVEGINNDRNTLPRSKLHAQIERLPADDSFHASKRVCQLLRSGVAGIFGPQSENTANHVQSICDAMEIPHIETRWDFKLTRDAYSINLFPHPTSLGQAYYDVIKALGWKNFVILYDTNLGLVRLQSLLRVKEWTIRVCQLDSSRDWRPLLKEIKKTQETKFVVDVAPEKIYEVMKQASQIGLNREYHSYFLTSLDMHLIDMEDFRYSGSNITALRLIDPNKPEVQKVVEDWMYGELRYGRTLKPNIKQITTEAALMYDAVHLFARSLDDLDRAREVDITALYCEGDKTWQHGNSLINYMKWYSSRRGGKDDLSGNPFPDIGMPGLMSGMRPGMNMGMRASMNMNPEMINHQDYSMVSNQNPFQPYMSGNMNNNMTSSKIFDQVQVYGLTGLIKFDAEGFRTDFELEITELNSKTGLAKVGIWTQKGGTNYTRNLAEETDSITLSLQNRTLIVYTALTAPYSMLKETSESLTGNDRFEGFCIDLIEHIAVHLGFNYTFMVEENDVYGSKNKETGEWNGMIRKLLDHEADMAIVDFTITYEREEAVDFSMPFMNLGIGIIYKKPQRKPPSLFSFMSPFSIDVWIYMATAYLGVSVLLFVLARITPHEWDNPHPCIQDPDELENSITLNNAFWFTIGSLMQQGSDIAPKAVSTRIVAGIWWFFTLIMISSYTANLAAFLTVERMESPIEGAEDLAAQTKIKFGCKQGGSTYGFFSESKIPTYQRMWSAMSNARPTVFTPTNDDGVERVSSANGMYAFLMESVSIEYEIERKCDLTQVGGLLDSKSYGIALPPGSPYTGTISSAVLKLKENGILHQLKTKWWKMRKGGGACKQSDPADAASEAELGLDNVGGIFVAVVFGSAMACIMACFEFTWKARKLAAQEGDSFWKELWVELKFIASGTNEKPVRKYPRKDPEPAVVLPSYSSTIYSNSNNYGYGDK